MDRHSCESRNPAKLSPVNLDARFRGHDKKNTPTSQLLIIGYKNKNYTAAWFQIERNRWKKYSPVMIKT
jgi:hypothetical protein